MTDYSRRGALYSLLDNIIGYDDGVTTPGERLGKGLNSLGAGLLNDPAGLVGGLIGNTKRDLDNLMFEGGARERPEAVLGYAAAPMAPMSAPAGALRAGGIRAYHGSPHDFDRFQMDKIGTGEGAQAYGHGLYFAENEGVARSYRDALAGRSAAGSDPVANAWDMMYRLAPDDPVKAAAQRDEIRQSFVEMAQGDDKYADFAMRTVEAIDSGEVARFKPPGSMYEVNINADPADFLDWDAPLSEQPETVKGLFAPVGERWKRMSPDADPSGSTLWGQAEGGALRLEDDFSPVGGVTATDKLRDAGIPGIKYRDQGSRGLDGETGTRNFVVFDENLIEIVRKYGIAGAAAMLGVTAAEVEAAVNQPQGLLD